MKNSNTMYIQAINVFLKDEKDKVINKQNILLPNFIEIIKYIFV